VLFRPTGTNKADDTIFDIAAYDHAISIPCQKWPGMFSRLDVSETVSLQSTTDSRRWQTRAHADCTSRLALSHVRLTKDDSRAVIPACFPIPTPSWLANYHLASEISWSLHLNMPPKGCWTCKGSPHRIPKSYTNTSHTLQTGEWRAIGQFQHV
jgi:hypothetical protein